MANIKLRGSTGGNDREWHINEILDYVFGTTSGTSLIRTSAGWRALTLGGNWAQFGQSFFAGGTWVTVALTATASTSGGAVASWQPPEGGIVIITRAIIYTTTKSTSAANVSVGVATNTTTSSANLLDTLDVGTAVVCADNITDKGTGGKSRQLMSATQAVTVTGSADTTGLVGNLYLEYMHP